MRRRLVNEFCARFIKEIMCPLMSWKTSIAQNADVVACAGICRDCPYYLPECWRLTVVEGDICKIILRGCTRCRAEICANWRTTPIMLAFRLAPSATDVRWADALSTRLTPSLGWVFTSDASSADMCLSCDRALTKGAYGCDKFVCISRVWELVHATYVIWAITYGLDLAPDVKVVIIINYLFACEL